MTGDVDGVNFKLTRRGAVTKGHKGQNQRERSARDIISFGVGQLPAAKQFTISRTSDTQLEKADVVALVRSVEYAPKLQAAVAAVKAGEACCLPPRERRLAGSTVLRPVPKSAPETVGQSRGQTLFELVTLKRDIKREMRASLLRLRTVVEMRRPARARCTAG